MNCRRFQKNLFEYLDGALSGRRKAAAEEHLAVCNLCREAVRHEQLLAELVSGEFQQSTTAIELDQNVSRRIIGKIREDLAPSSGTGSWLRSAMGWSAVAITLLLLTIAIGRFSIATHPSRVKGARMADEPQPRPAVIDLSYCVPAYTFRREENLVVDALTCDSQVINGALLFKN